MLISSGSGHTPRLHFQIADGDVRKQLVRQVNKLRLVVVGDNGGYRRMRVSTCLAARVGGHRSCANGPCEASKGERIRHHLRFL